MKSSSCCILVLAALIAVQITSGSSRRYRRDDDDDDYISFRKKFEASLSSKCTGGCPATHCCAMYYSEPRSKFSFKWLTKKREYKCASKPIEGETCSITRDGFETACNECAPGLYCKRRRCAKTVTTLPPTSTVPPTTAAPKTTATNKAIKASFITTTTAKPDSSTDTKCKQACQPGYCCSKTQPASLKSTGSKFRDSMRKIFAHLTHNEYSCSPMNAEGEKCTGVQDGFTSSCGCADGLQCGSQGLCVKLTTNSTAKATTTPEVTTQVEVTSTSVHPTTTKMLPAKLSKKSTTEPKSTTLKPSTTPGLTTTTPEPTTTTPEPTTTTPEPTTTTPEPTTTTPQPTTTTPQPTTTTPQPTTTTPQPTTTTPQPTTTTPQPTTTTPQPTTTTPQPTTTTSKPTTTTTKPTITSELTTNPPESKTTTPQPTTAINLTPARTRPVPAGDRSTPVVRPTTSRPQLSAASKCKKACGASHCCAKKKPASIEKTGSAIRDSIRTFWTHVLHNEYECAAMSAEGEKCDKVQNGFTSSCGCGLGLECGNKGMCVKPMTSTVTSTTTTTTTEKPITSTQRSAETTTQLLTTPARMEPSSTTTSTTAAAAPQCAERDTLVAFCVDMRDAMATLTIPTVELLFQKYCDQSGLVPSLWTRS